MRSASLILRVITGAALCLCAATASAGGAPASDDATLLDKARALELAESRAWRALLHYEPRWLSAGEGSIAISARFFLSPQGREDAQAELEATLAKLLAGDRLPDSRQPVRCAFPARAEFLRRRLDIQDARFSADGCSGYARWRASLNAPSASIVFPTAYLNSPASMFGHTLLRLDAAGDEGGSELLAHAVNFAADTQENRGAAFAYRGLAGGYTGQFGVYPYYEKVKQYAWIENRDIWSWPLALSAEELDRLLAHLWELREVRFDYYFLTKNCSYQLLALLQVARPELDLLSQFRAHAIPGETIRALAQSDDLLGPARHRASLRTRLDARLAKLSDEQIDWVRALSEGDGRSDMAGFAQLPATQRARLLELAHDHLFYQQRVTGQARDERTERLSRLLLARSQIAGAVAHPVVPAPPGDPGVGHAAFRLGVGPRWREDEFSLALRLRPSYHDLLDPPAGFLENATLSFLDTHLSLSPGDAGPRIEYLGLAEIESLSPRSRLFKPVSWSVRGGLRRPGPAGMVGEVGLGGFLEGGPGLAWSLRPEATTAYVFALAAVDYNADLEHNHALGAGARAGLVHRLGPRWRGQVEAGALGHVSGGEARGPRWLRLDQQVDLLPELALRLELSYTSDGETRATEAALLLQRYF